MAERWGVVFGLIRQPPLEARVCAFLRTCALRQLQRRRHADSEGAGAADDAVRPLEGLRDPEHEEGALGQARLVELLGCGTLDFCAAGFLTAARSRAVLRARSASARPSAWPRAYPSGLGPPAWLRAVLLRRWRASNDAAAALARQGIFIVDVQLRSGGAPRQGRRRGPGTALQARPGRGRRGPSR